MGICTTCGREWPDEFKLCPNDGSSLRSSTGTADLIGSVIADRYLIKSKLGQGGMGAVYLAEHVRMGQQVAVKIISRQLAGDPDAIARFTREARHAASIKHPNVCTIHDFGETADGLMYLAMEFVEGEALADLLKRQGTLSIGRASNIVAQCCDALQAAHDLGIIHRDIKPDNIMITRQRDGSEGVKVVDFGIAKAASDETAQAVTKTGFIVGTPEYMSPEQASGQVLDNRSDVYSLALVLFRMLTNGLPFRGDTPQAVLVERLITEPLKLTDVRPQGDLPSQVQAVIDRALAKDPEGRFASAMEFEQAVVAAAQGVEPEPAGSAPSSDVPTMRIDEAALVSEQLTVQLSDAPTPETPQPIVGPAGDSRRRATRVAAFATVGLLGAVAIWIVNSSGTSTIPTSLDGASGEPLVRDSVADSLPALAAANPTDSGAEIQAPARTDRIEAAGPETAADTGGARADPERDEASATVTNTAELATWTVVSSLTDAELQGVWGSGPSDVWAVGGRGTLLHYDGTEWNYALSPEHSRDANTRLGTVGLDAVWGSSATDVWAVGSIGTILHYDGTTWTDHSPDLTRNRLYGVWGSGPADVWAVGERGTTLHFDGNTWTEREGKTLTSEDLLGVWSNGADNVWAVGESATILHYDGTAWSDATTDVTTEWLYGVWGSSADDVWAVGGSGTILRYDGTVWTDATPLRRLRSGNVVPEHNHLLSGIWGTGPRNVWAAADYTIIHYDGENWTDRTPDERHRLRHVWAAGAADGWAVGWWGLMLRLSR